MSTSHIWQFYRIGGFDQVALTTAADLENLHTLDQKLWAALSCPVKGLELDEKTLALLDSDNDGRIRVPELLAAIKWCRPYFKDLAVLLSGKGLHARRLSRARLRQTHPRLARTQRRRRDHLGRRHRHRQTLRLHQAQRRRPRHARLHR
ncbi:MAG: hypothetical protein MUE42_09600 [Opitutaceae bacterium]|nr:hypothetical protein [Opitutaceae bacterium]